MASLAFCRSKSESATARMDGYLGAVRRKKIVAGRLVRLAVDRELRDRRGGAARGLRFDEDLADYAVRFVECLRHSKGQWRGQPLHLEPWQTFIVASLFGWQRIGEDGDWRRRFNTAFISTGKKNGKTTLAAALAHLLFVGDGEAGAEVYCAASTKDQARLVHEEAKRMARSSPCLKRILEIYKDSMVCGRTESRFSVLAANAGPSEGLGPSAIVVDELHVLPNRELFDALEGGTSARRNPLLLVITTAGRAGDEESIYAELRGYSERVLSGQHTDDSWFAFIARLDPEDDWQDERAWPKANPNLGVSVEIEDLRRKCSKAACTPAAVASVKRRICNLEVAISEGWFNEALQAAWRDCQAGHWHLPSGLAPEVIERLRNRDCYVGGDLSSLSDLTALVFASPDSAGLIDVVPFCWCPRENAIGRTRDKNVPYLTWAELGHLMLTQGNSVDYDALRALLRKARDDWRWNLRVIAFDPSNARYLLTKLAEEDGFLGEGQILEHPQTCGVMNEAIGAAEKAILDRKIRHGGHQPLRWCLANAVTYQDTGARRRFNKRKSREKIDLAQAMVMGIGQALAQQRTGGGFEVLG